jgi:hypothetical protein
MLCRLLFACKRVVRSAASCAIAILFALCACCVTPVHAGSIFIAGHDPDFHAVIGYNAPGARHFNQVAIHYILDPAFNSFASTAHKFLYVESNIDTPPGHTRGTDGIVASGFALGVDFEQHDASTLNAQLDSLGTKYSGIVVASDYGACLTQAELDILNARVNDIVAFLNTGGGIYAMAESNHGAELTPGGGHFGFLPSVISSIPGDEFEIDYSLSPFGTSLGLTLDDINDNVRHNVFNEFAARIHDLSAVDYDTHGQVISLAGRSFVTVARPVTWGAIKALYAR